MYEYRSLRASTYDVDSLIDRLNGADGDGWEVVTVVPAGGDMVAIVRRPRGTADAAVAAVGEPAVVAAVAEVPVVAVEPEPEPVHTAPAVEEPAGWGAAPEPEVVAPVATSTYQPAAEVVEPMPMADSEPAPSPPPKSSSKSTRPRPAGIPIRPVVSSSGTGTAPPGPNTSPGAVSSTPTPPWPEPISRRRIPATKLSP